MSNEKFKKGELVEVRDTCEGDWQKVDNTDKGKKYDEGKLRWDLLPIEEIEKVVEVITFGAEKYGENDWQKVDNFKNKYYAALMRHIVAWREGDKIDKESKKEHLAHAAACILFLMWGDENNGK